MGVATAFTIIVTNLHSTKMNSTEALLSIFALLFCFSFLPVQGGKPKLRIQSLIPQNNDVFSNDGVIPALNMALDDINNNDSILSNYELVSEISDTKCDASEGTWKLIKSILDTDVANETRIIVYLGGACSLVTEPTSALSGRLYKVVQISFAATSPVLSERTMYPLFFRTSPSEILYNDVRFALMKTFKWCYVATLHQTANIFSLSVQNFHDHFPETLGGHCKEPTGNNDNDDNDNMPVLFSFTDDPEIPLTQIQSKNIRIILGYFYEDRALVVMCYAYHLNLITVNHLWLLPSWYSDGWWNRANDFDWDPYKYNCSSSDILKAINMSILFDVYPYLEDPTAVSVSGYTNESFFNEYYKRRDQYFNITPSTPQDKIPNILYTTLIYDAVWAVAMALNATDSQLRSEGHDLTEFLYSDTASDTVTFSSNISGMIASHLKTMDFIGVSGRVRFDANGTRLAVTGISQYVHESPDSLRQEFLGVYDRERDNLTINSSIRKKILWKGNGSPTDKNKPLSRLINQPLIYTMDVLIGAGIIISVALLIFNIVTIRKPLIKDSAPHINTVIIIGCIVMMATCVLLGIDSGTPQVVTDRDRADVLNEINVDKDNKYRDRYAAICMIRLWLLTIGFTLSFGALFAKTWQVYRVYTNEQLKEQPFKMWNFLIIMSVQLVVDVIFLSIWTGFFPFRHEIARDTDNVNNIVNIFEKCDCDSFSYLIGTLYVYKGLLVVFGLFLAYESRNVKYHYINDSRFVSISMYIVVILICISAPISLVLADRNIIDAAYAVAVSMIIIACMCCLLILYIPKFIYMSKGADTMIPKSKGEVFTPVDNLQLGHTDVNPEDVQTAEQEIRDLKQQVKIREIELLNLQTRRGSDQDSGVLCTSVDENGDSSNGQPESPVSSAPQTTNDTALAEEGAAVKKKSVTISSHVDVEQNT